MKQISGKGPAKPPPGQRGKKRHPKVEVKIATAAYMLSEWFEDCWWEGDTHTSIRNLALADIFEEREGS